VNDFQRGCVDLSTFKNLACILISASPIKSARSLSCSGQIASYQGICQYNLIWREMLKLNLSNLEEYHV
jgi:hypothetical protein